MKKPFIGAFRLTQGWGENPDIYKQFGLKGHNGQDWGLPTGTEIIAPHNGKVLEAVKGDTGYGNYVKIESDIEGSLLAHLQSFSVKVGDLVIEGQTIAISNNTGFSTGPHLHWGYYRIPRNRNDGYAGYINQASYLEIQMVTIPQKELDDIRLRRDELFNQNQTLIGKEGEYQHEILELQNANKTLNDKITDFG